MSTLEIKGDWTITKWAKLKDGMKPEWAYSASDFEEKVSELANYLYVLRGCRKSGAISYRPEAEERLKKSIRSEARASQARKAK